MAQQEKTLFIPLKGGLDLYSNPHLLDSGTATAATGVSFNRPGYAYAGPGFSALPTGLGNTQQQNYGIATYTQSNKLADQLLVWASPDNRFGSGTGTVGVGPVSQPAFTTPLYPWRQQVARIFPGEGTKTGLTTESSMSSPPQMVGLQGGNLVYVWRTASNHFVAIVQQNGIPTGPYYLNTTFGWVSDPTVRTPTAVTGTKWVLVGNQFGFTVIWLDGSGAVQSAGQVYPMATGLFGTATTAGPFTDLDGISAPAEFPNGQATIVVRDNVNTSLKAANVPSGSTVGTMFSVITGLPAGSTAPITCCAFVLLPTSQYFGFATFNASNQPVIVVCDALNNYANISNKTITSYGSYTAGTLGTPVQIAMASSWGRSTTESAGSIGVAIEWKPAAAYTPVTGTNYTPNSVLFLNLPNYATGTPLAGLTAKLVSGWGGLALLAKPYNWAWQTVTDPVQGAQYRTDWVIPVRSGWRAADGTFGTATTAGVPMAYPNGYLYNINGQLIGRFGDADVGSDALWPEFASASYTPQSLPVLAHGIGGSLANGALTVAWTFPQYSSFQTVSSRTADAGAVIGAKPGLSTVILEAPTLVEPMAPAHQMGNTLAIPGLLTAYYDGSKTVEAGFLHRSPTPWVALLAGGAIPVGVQRFYQTVLMYTDRNGRVHYGAPSRPVLSPLTTGGNQSFTIGVPYCKQTLKNGLQPTQILVYASIDNPGTSFNSASISMYLIAASSLVNNPEAVSGPPVAADYYTTITDTNLTATVSTLPNIYTQGFSTLAATGNDAPPAFDCLTLWNNRLWGVANRNGPELWFTWPLDTATLQPEAPAWSRQNRIALPADIGQPRAIVGLDDKLLVLGTRADYGITGDGPARTGTYIEYGGFSTPIQLPTPGGIQVLNGATRIPQGILFQAAQGFTLLDRSLTYQHIGNPVNTYTDLAGNLYGPGVFNTANQCVMLFSVLGAQYDLMYFYGEQEWSQCEHPGVNSSTDTTIVVASTRLVNGASGAYVIPATGTNYYQVTPFSTYMSYRTPWIEMGDSGTMYSPKGSVAGYGMLRELQLVGDPGGGGFTTTLFTEYDYSNNTAQPPETTTLSSVTGDAQWRFGFANGNCRRVRLTITINAGRRGTATQPPVYLAGLMLTYATDQGLSRLGSGNST